nr:MAG TPA: hypothetical protein [Caudoviricetes sp.]
MFNQPQALGEALYINFCHLCFSLVAWGLK